jgi:diguanylate cyclase (GGDEF)-like protein
VTAAAVGAALPVRTGLPVRARRFLLATLAAAAAVPIAGAGRGSDVDLKLFAALLVAAPAAQAAATRIGRNQVFHVGLAFAVAAALLLPPAGFVAVCLAQHLPDWARQRYPWYIQSFNVANYVLSAAAGWAVATAAPDATAALVLGAAAFVLVNHLLLARMLRLARGHSLRQSGLFGAESLLTDATLAAVGVGFAVLLPGDALAAAVVALPLVLIRRAAIVPELRAQANLDPKTDLLNMRAFRQAAEAEISRAARFDRPLAVLVADVDDLRGMNSRHGHLAGDAAVVAVADALRLETREYDLRARFGGDEFVVLMPETRADEAAAIGRRIVRRLESTPLHEHGVTVGLSVGVAVRGGRHENLDALLDAADEAMYADKEAAG